MINHIFSTKVDQHGQKMRTIRSFVRRQRRLTKRQQQALKNYWPIMGVEYQVNPINIATLFNRNASTILEIGFGTGSSLVAIASDRPQQNFIGIEVYLPGVGSCLANAYSAKLSNLYLICHDAVEVLSNMIPDSSLDIVQLFFPDPWHKSHHNKRRIIQPYFAKLVLQKLKINGLFHIATDWQAYAEHIVNVMQTITGYYNISNDNSCLLPLYTRAPTKFELRGQRLGHPIWDLKFIKK